MAPTRCRSSIAATSAFRALGSSPFHCPPPHWTQDEQGQSHDRKVHDRGHQKYHVPASGGLFDHVGGRDQKGGSPLRGVEHAEVYGGEFRPECIGAGRGEQAEYL